MSLSKEGLGAAFWGAGPVSQLDGDGLRVHWVPVSFVSVSFTHTPLHSRPHTSLFHAPLGCLCLPVPTHPAPQPLFLLLPCLALALILGITHPLYVHNSPSALAHEHTHSYCSGTWFPCILPVMHTQCPCPYTHMHICIPTQPESYSNPCLMGSSQLLIHTPHPQFTPTSASHSPSGDIWHPHVCEHKHMYPCQNWSASSSCYPCTPPTVMCVIAEGVSWTLSGLSGIPSPTLTSSYSQCASVFPQSPVDTYLYVCACEISSFWLLPGI